MPAPRCWWRPPGVAGWRRSCRGGWGGGGGRWRCMIRARSCSISRSQLLWAGTPPPISRCCAPSRSCSVRWPRIRRCPGWLTPWPPRWTRPRRRSPPRGRRVGSGCGTGPGRRPRTGRWSLTWTPLWSPRTRRRKRRAAPGRRASVTIRCWAMSITVRVAPGSPYPGCCAPATPGRTPLPTTSPCSSRPSRSCPSRCAPRMSRGECRCWCAPTAPGPPTSSPRTCTPRGWSSPWAPTCTSSTSTGCSTRCRPPHGPRHIRPTSPALASPARSSSPATGRGSPRRPTCSTFRPGRKASG